MKKLKTILLLGFVLAITSCSKEDPNTKPDAPIIGTAIAGNAIAKIAFTAPTNDGGSAITAYTATSTPEDIVGVLQEIENDTIVVTGLTNGTEYTFTITATNAIGTSEPSAVSNVITPVKAPDWYYNCYEVYDSWGYYLYDDCYWEYY
jgi:hypothetical protein